MPTIVFDALPRWNTVGARQKPSSPSPTSPAQSPPVVISNIKKKDADLPMHFLRKFLAVYRALVNLLVVCFTIGVILMFGILPKFGIQTYEVVSGSMEPKIPMGSVVFLNTHDRDFDVGDVVAYHVDIPEYDPILHRIYAPGDKPGTWKMKGDANEGIDFGGSDRENISESDMIGTVIFHLPLLGAVMWFLSLFPWWLLLLLFIVLFMSPDLFEKILTIAFSSSDSPASPDPALFPPISPANPHSIIGESGGEEPQPNPDVVQQEEKA